MNRMIGHSTSWQREAISLQATLQFGFLHIQIGCKERNNAAAEPFLWLRDAGEAAKLATNPTRRTLSNFNAGQNVGAMGRPSVTALGLCLLCLLGNWQIGQAKKISDIKLDAYEKRVQKVNCKEGEVIHIKSAIYSGFNKQCPKRVDRTEKIRSRCEGRQKCEYIPHWKRSDGLYVNLGDVCNPGGEYLRGDAECWNPCLDVNCGKGGKCTPLTHDSYKCACSEDDKGTGVCQPKKSKVIMFSVYENRLRKMDCNNGEFIHIKSAIYAGNCSKQVTRTEKLRTRCENRQKCEFMPHWNKDNAPYINLGDVCYPGGEYLRGVAECWNPCFGVNCGEGGKCAPLNYKDYKCVCNKGYVNRGGESTTTCTKEKKAKDIKFEVKEEKQQTIDCDQGEVIHITKAVWRGSGIFCKKEADRTERIRSRCEGRQKCKFIPHWDRDDAPHVSLGDLCFGYVEILKGEAQCWNPCNGVDCGEGGKCERVAYDAHRCACDKGYANADDKPDGICKKSNKMRTIQKDVPQKEMQTIECGEGEVIHIKSAIWSTSDSACPDADKTETLRYRCEGLQSCKFKPHWSLDYFHWINLGESCFGHEKKLKLEAECWNPCNGVSCKEGVCMPATFNTHKCEKRDARHTKTIRMEKMETEAETLSCKEGEFIHIKAATWSGFVPHCNDKIDVVEKVREKCGNNQKCEFIPHWFQEDGSLILQSNCPKTGEYIRGEAQCWNPCLGAKCDEGKRCTPLTYNTHKCE